MGKKKKAHGPRRKRMQRTVRLASARATQWVDKYTGKNIVRGYCKWFGVDELCAIIELRLLGVPLSEEREDKLRQKAARRSITAAGRKDRKRKLAECEEADEYHPDAVETFALIAGYKPAGFAYGTTWDQLGATPLWLAEEESEQTPACDFKKVTRLDDELPF